MLEWDVEEGVGEVVVVAVGLEGVEVDEVDVETFFAIVLVSVDPAGN